MDGGEQILERVWFAQGDSFAVEIFMPTSNYDARGGRKFPNCAK
jgi:hypothetical protein